MNIKYLILGILICGMISSCHKCSDPTNSDCRNYDPCYGQTPINAKFIIEEASFSERLWVPYATDTCRPYDITFRALTDGAQYDWRIGAGRYTTQQVDLSFSGVPDGNIPITLIIHKAVNLKCFPKDDGIDTLVKTLYIRRNRCYVYGSYRGAFTDDPSHPFTITIEHKLAPPSWYSFARQSCGDSMLVQTSGWPIPQSQVSGTYPCGEKALDLSSRRELFFNVQSPDDSINSVSPEYPFCRALLDSTYTSVTIMIEGLKHDPGGSNNLIPFNKVFIGIKQ